MKQIQLYGKYANGAVVKVDDIDYKWLNQWRWHACLSGNLIYARRTECIPGGDTNSIMMHRLIMNIQDSSIFTDHIDHNGLNNQRSNLRLATNSQNGANRRKGTGLTSKYKGVCINTRYNEDRTKKYTRYQAVFTLNGKQLIKMFKKEEDAAMWYNEMAIKHRGEYALLNIIEKL